MKDVARTFAGGTPSRSDATLFGGLVPWVKSAEVANGLIISTEESLTELGLASSAAKWCEPGSTLIAMYGANAGQVGRLGIRAATNQAVLCIEASSPEDQAFLYHAVSAAAPKLLGRTQGSGQPNLNASIIRSLELPWPDGKTRDRVARCLDLIGTMEGAISRFLTAKRAFKRALMNDLLTGRRRFREFVGLAWPMRKLEEIAAINPESLLGSTDPNQEIRYIEISALRGGTIALPDHAIPFGDAPSRARRIATSNDVLFSTVRPYLQGFAIVDEGHNEDLVCSTGFAVIRPDNVVDARFILENLYSSRVSRQTNAALVGSSYPALNEGDVRRLTIPWPSAEEREKIAGVLWAARMEIAELEQLATLYSALKRGLMQRLLSGEIEIPEHLTAATAAAEANDDDS